jgi:hypothetical protein
MKVSVLATTLAALLVATPAAAQVGPAPSADPSPPVASAPPSAQTSATAESLFREGRALTEAGDHAAACAKFEASQALEPTAGTLINLADCHERLGRTATAWAEFLRVAAMSRSAGQTDRERVARDRARALEPKLVRLQVTVEPEAAIEALVVRRGATTLPPASWGSSIPVDPGTHVVVANAPGFEEFSTEVVVEQPGQTVTVHIPPLTPKPLVVASPAPVPETQPAQPAQPAPPPALPPPVAERPVDPGSGQRTLAIVIGSVGLGGVALGSVYGVMAKGSWDDATDAGCSNGTCPTARAQDYSDDANSQATVSTISMAAGGALLGAGIVLYLLAPEQESTTFVPQVTQHSAALGLGGRF